MLIMDDVEISTLDPLIVRKKKSLKSFIGIINFNQAKKLALVKDKYLSRDDLSSYENLKVQKKKDEYLCGQFVLKKLIAKYLDTNDLNSFDICKGSFNQPYVRGKIWNLPGISLAHSGNYALGICFPLGHPMGIDIEPISRTKFETLQTQMTELELSVIEDKFESRECGIMQFWSMKEALSKAIRCGLMTPFKIMELDKIEVKGDGTIECRFLNFGQYRGYSVIIHNYVMTIVLPYKSSINENLSQLF